MQEKDLIIIGSGPAGLRAGEEAKRQNIDYLILERGKIAQAWRDIRPEMPMLSPNHPQRDWTSISPNFPIWKLDVRRPYCTASEFVMYLERYSEHFNLNIKTNTKVTNIELNGDLYHLKTSKGNYKAKTILNSSGFFGNSYIPNIPGMRKNPIVTHSHEYQNLVPFKSNRVVIIGGGNSAAEIAIDLVGYSQVYLITRGELEFFSDTNNLCHIRGISESLLNELIKMELIRYIPNADIHRVEDNRLYYNNTCLETAHIICATGYRPVLDHLSSLPVQIHKKSKFPLVEPSGSAKGISSFYFGGPLGYDGLRSLFIHGFIRSVSPTIDAIKNALQLK